MHTIQPPPSGACLSSLEPSRNNCTISDVQGSAAQRKFFGKDWALRARLILSLRQSDDQTLLRRAERIDGCCHTPQLRSDRHGKPSLLLNCCRDRLCPRCQRERGRRAALKITSHVQTWSSCRFFTLTQVSRREPLDQSLARLHESFRGLRRHPAFRQRVKQGVWSIEVTRNIDLGTWHVHVHILTEGDYFAQDLLSNLWHKITGDSRIVDVRAVHDRERTAKYIAEYVSKPLNAERWQPGDICEYATALHGRRLIHTFGTRATEPNVDAAEPAGDDKSDLICPLSWIAVAADRHEPRALHAMEIMRRMGPTWSAASGQEPRDRALPVVPVEQWEHDFLFNVGREAAIRHWSDAQPETPPPSKRAAARQSYGTVLPWAQMHI